MSIAFYAEYQIYPWMPALRELVMFAGESEMVCHHLHPDCSIECPHHIETCQAFTVSREPNVVMASTEGREETP
jgi:hypothetical protein